MTCHKLLASAAILLIVAVWNTQAVNYYKQGSTNENYNPPSRGGARPPYQGQTGHSNALWIRTRDAPIDTIRYGTPMDRRMVPASMLFDDRNLDKRLFGDLFQSDERAERYRRIAALLSRDDDF